MVFKDLAIIVFTAKIFGIIAKKVKVPQVAGEIIAGLLIGPCILNFVQINDFLIQMAEIGVILLMFSTGLETNLHDLIKTGPAALLIAIIGVAVPLGGGTLLYSLFYHIDFADKEQLMKAVFIGTIMTATSVGITVQALRELGHLKGKIGTLIVSSAIIDDVIGIIVLTFVIGMKTPESDPVKILVSTLLFFVFSGVVGYIIYFIFKKIDARYSHQRRIPILGLALCMAMAYIAEKYFGIADITGAYVAGLILCNIEDSEYIAGKMDINSYMLFGPIFFASIGLKTEFSGFTKDILVFSLLFVVVAMITKIVGCGFIAKLFKYKTADALIVGIGMMTRGEVALIVAQKGLAVGLLDSKYFASVILLIIVSSIIVPILLKILFKKSTEQVEIKSAQ